MTECKTAMEKCETAKTERKWWHGKTAYQIYPKSFYDSNGDGIGDLRGIIEKLDYLKELGIGILWISPVYVSPCADQGYDIADYYQIDPVFGTMEDMDLLLEEAKKRDIAVLMDLVVNHCSDEHEWFQKALKDPEGEYGKLFYFEKRKDGKLPTNWRSYFGGPVWEPVEGTDWCYLHLFHKKQPDLNWENPKLREAIYKMVNWWLEKGLAGFRIDAIINIKKPLPFQDYPADREDGLCSMDQVLAHAEGIGEFLGELKERAFAPHDALTIGEVFNVTDAQLEEFIGEHGYFSSMFDFRETLEGKSVLGWYDCKQPTPEEYKKCCFESQKQSEKIGYLSNIIENHDEPRGVSHYLPEAALMKTAAQVQDCRQPAQNSSRQVQSSRENERGKKLLACMYFMLRGLPFIYQGQELGMENNEFRSMDEVDDVNTWDQYRRCLAVGFSEEEALKVVSHYSRDNARTPFHWSDDPQAGFTTGTPWLAVNRNYRTINAKEQMGREDSVYAFYKKLTALRQNPEYAETIVYGTTEPVLEEEENIMAYFRRSAGQTLLVLGNFDSVSRTVHVVNRGKKVFGVRTLLDNCDCNHSGSAHSVGSCRETDGTITLLPYQALVLEV